MRTTLELDDDLIASAKVMAMSKGVSLGRMISDMARKSLIVGIPQVIRNHVPLIRPKPGVPQADLELVNRLRDDS